MNSKTIVTGSLLIIGLFFSSMIVNTNTRSQTVQNGDTEQKNEAKPAKSKVAEPKSSTDSLKLAADSVKIALIKDIKELKQTEKIQDKTSRNLRKANDILDDLTPVLKGTEISEAEKKPVILDSVTVSVADSVKADVDNSKKKGLLRRVFKFLHL